MNVLLVPGLYVPGPAMESLQKAMYSSALPLWKMDGHTMHLYQFGWNDEVSLADRQNDLLQTVDALPGSIHAIGASAGGLAVINAMRDRPDKIIGAATVASPLNITEQEFSAFEHTLPIRIPRILKAAYQEADACMQAEPYVMQKIVSVYGRRDKRVQPQWSQRPGIRSEELPTKGHSLTILGAITAYRKRVQTWLS